MYDFYFGTREAVQNDEKKFLLSVKRMLPRWCNSIPDSEYLALVDILEENFAKPHPVLVETGTGASTIVLLHHALKYDGVLFSWDFVGPKAAYLRGVIQDTLLNYDRKNIFDYWKSVAFDSLSPHLGLSVLSDLVDQVDCCFLDSEHTLNTVLGELERLNSLLTDGSVVTMDDANYDYRHTNFAYINMQRKKLGLSDLASPPDNHTAPFYQEVESYLRNRWERVVHLEDNYKTSYQQDLFFAYHNAERATMNEAGMEKLGNLEHRFDAWRVSGRIIG